MEKTFKTFNAVAKNADSETGIVDIVIPMSTGSVDRDGESIKPSAWRKRLGAFKKHPVLLSSHNYYELQKQIGEWTEIKVTAEGLVGKPKYYINMGNAEADWGFFLASIGMAAYSVGFMPYEVKEMPDGDGDTTPRLVYTDVELLEISHVVVPSNRDAAQEMRTALTSKGVKIPDAIDTMFKEVEGAESAPAAPDDSGEGELEIPEHSGVQSVKAFSQDELADELDYCQQIVEAVGISDKVKGTALSLAQTIKRITGSDIPDVIMEETEPLEKLPDQTADTLKALALMYRQYRA